MLLLPPRRRMYLNRRCLFVSLLATLRKTPEQIFMKFSEKVGNGLTNKWLNFGGDLDPNRDTGKACLCGGMHCASASSFLNVIST